MSQSTATSRRMKAIALLAAGAAAGVIGAASIAATAQTTTTTPSTSSTSSTTSSTGISTTGAGDHDGDHGGDHGGRHGGGAGETVVTGTRAATLKAIALKHVPGATVDEITTDSGDAAFEVHLTKADGTDVTVKFDKNLAFVNTESGRGK